MHKRRRVASCRGPRAYRKQRVERLPLYYRALVELDQGKAATVSSESLAELTGVNAAKVRKDLSYLGTYGTRGVGYDVENLMHQIARELGLTQDWPVVIVGIGNLGRALASYSGFSARGFRIAALLDADPGKTGLTVGKLAIRPTADLGSIANSEDVAIGIIATPGSAAQDVGRSDGGMRHPLDFELLGRPYSSSRANVTVRRVDLALELQILSFHHGHNEHAEQAG